MEFICSNFSSAHFLDFECLHGHNFNVKIIFEEKENLEKIKKNLNKICNKLDHKILIPQKSKTINVYKQNKQIMIKTKNKTYIFPEQDVVILPIEETTVELIVEYINTQLKKENIGVISVILEESHDSIGIL